MKKINRFLSILFVAEFGISAFGCESPQNDGSTSDFINTQGVQISLTEYEKLLQVGYTDIEIKTLNREQVDEINAMHIRQTYTDSYYIKTTLTTQLNGKNVFTDERLTESQVNEEIAMLGLTDPDVSVPATTTYRHMTVSVSHAKNSGACEYFFTKVTLEWLIAPVHRFNDIIAISFGNTVSLSPSTDFNFLLTYADTNGDTITAIAYNEKDKEQYYYYTDKGLAVKCPLPKNTRTDICVSLSAYFFPITENINATGFVGTYAHQISDINLNWSDISLLRGKPYFSFSTSLPNESAFDNPLGSVVLLSDIAD